jgi:hypothetical protein
MRLIFRRKPQDIAEEIRSHVDLDRDQLIAGGTRPEDAHFAALRRFGISRSRRSGSTNLVDGSGSITCGRTSGSACAACANTQSRVSWPSCL